MQIDKLVQLLESPIFIQLRLHLLEADSASHPDLLKSLYGLLMLLPQSQAYKTLSDRLTTVSPLHMHIGLSRARNSSNLALGAGSSVVQKVTTSSLSPPILPVYEALIAQFEKVQERHTEFRLSLLRQKSLLPASNNFDSLALVGATQLPVSINNTGSS
jgi:vacuole morphology and inheritance protein 14